MQHVQDTADEMAIWYRQPAERWPDALPVGNGRLAAMVYGGVRAERINLDESTFWAGEPAGGVTADDNVPPDGPAAVAEIRRLLFEGQVLAANELTNAINGRKLNYGTHLPFGTLRLFFDHGDDDVSASDDGATGYCRMLDLDRGVASVAYTAKGAAYRREVFADHDSQVIVVRLTCDAPGALGCRIALDGGEQPYFVRAEEAGTLLMDCDAYEPAHSDNATGVHGHARLLALTDGTLSVAGAQSRVVGAAQITLLIAINTTFPTVDSAAADPAALCREQIAAAAARPYDDLLAGHLADHRRYFRRVSLDLGHSPHPDWPTDRRIAAARGGEDDPALCALLFQFGRYLLLSSSRPDSPLPAHLTGIWNDGVACRIGWTCDYHLDINTQMNYWIAEVGNLGECTQPLFRWMGERLAPSGRHTARALYDCPGWVAHIVSNAWGFSAPGWSNWWGHFVTGGAWVAAHLWDHYAFSGDRAFLAEQAYPLLREAAEFFLAYLTTDPATGWLVSGPSISAENAYRWEGKPVAIDMGPTVDRVLIYELFDECRKAAAALGIDADFAARLAAAQDRQPPYLVGKHGQLQEWLADYDEALPNHRHTSHLLGLYPFAQITPEGAPSGAPDLARAARVSVERRLHAPGGYEEGAWARNNITLFYARLGDAQAVYDSLTTLFRVESQDSLMMGPKLAPHNAYEMDYTTGAAAGIAEMLVQSHAGRLALLPALPAAWAEGSVRGLCARGGFEVDMAWTGARLASARIRSRLGGVCRVLAAAQMNVYYGGVPVATTDAAGMAEFATVPGGEYVIAGR